MRCRVLPMWKRSGRTFSSAAPRCTKTVGARSRGKARFFAQAKDSIVSLFGRLFARRVNACAANSCIRVRPSQLILLFVSSLHALFILAVLRRYRKVKQLTARLLLSSLCLEDQSSPLIVASLFAHARLCRRPPCAPSHIGAITRPHETHNQALRSLHFWHRPTFTVSVCLCFFHVAPQPM